MYKNLKLLSAMFFYSLTLMMSQTAAAQECEEKYFSCKVSGKEVALCGAQLGDVFNIFFNIGKENIAEFSHGEKNLTVVEYSAGKVILSSVYFKAKGMVYAVTKCEGMECNPDKDSWLTIVKGNKKIKGSGFCEAGSSNGFENLPYTFDKKGNKIWDKKNHLSGHFSQNKNPKESFLIENIGWSD